MGRQSFKDAIRAKLSEGSVKAPEEVWEDINARLDEQDLIRYRSSQKRHRWVAVAAVLLAFCSFALHLDWRSKKDQNNVASYNALLENGSKNYALYQPAINSDHTYDPFRYQLNLPVVSQKTSKEKTDGKFIMPPQNEQSVAQNDLVAFDLIDPLAPPITLAAIENKEIETYYVAQYRGSSIGKTKPAKTYWAGLEAGTGNFSPEYNGGDRVNTSANFETIANVLGQSDFVNPSSSTTQNEMESGVMRAFGVDFGVKMGNKWTLESGIQYASLNNISSVSVNITDVITVNNPLLGSADIENTSARQTEIESNLDHTVYLENTMRFTSLPLKAGYYLMDQEISLRLNAGVTANYFLGSRLKDPSGQVENANSSNLYNEWSFDGLTGLELGYTISDNFNLTLEPSYLHSITPISSSLTDRSGFFVQTGLRYHIY